MNEFEIIKTYFKKISSVRKDVILGSGDDCALLKCPSKELLAVSMDTLISGVHFPKDLSPYEIAYKALAVNLSDLAAMGAEPAWFTCALSLTRSEQNSKWLNAFSSGLKILSKNFQLQLIGGDLTRSKLLSITIQIHGFVPQTLALRRDGAKIGDNIFVSGKLGYPILNNYYYRPQPRIKLGLALRGIANSAIDISDGLIADLSHILKSSKKGAELFLDKIPLVHPNGLTAGDDYELCFTVPSEINIQSLKLPEKITWIGKIIKPPHLHIYKADGSLFIPKQTGYQHF